MPSEASGKGLCSLLLTFFVILADPGTAYFCKKGSSSVRVVDDKCNNEIMITIVLLMK